MKLAKKKKGITSNPIYERKQIKIRDLVQTLALVQLGHFTKVLDGDVALAPFDAASRSCRMQQFL